MTVKDFFEGGNFLIFSIAMGADYSFYVKTIETHAHTFFKVIIFSIGSVSSKVESPNRIMDKINVTSPL